MIFAFPADVFGLHQGASLLLDALVRRGTPLKSSFVEGVVRGVRRARSAESASCMSGLWGLWEDPSGYVLGDYVTFNLLSPGVISTGPGSVKAVTAPVLPSNGPPELSVNSSTLITAGGGSPGGALRRQQLQSHDCSRDGSGSLPCLRGDCGSKWLVAIQHKRSRSHLLPRGSAH